MGIGVVETKSGKISGVEYSGRYEGITFFKGIPYAAPPVGKLRWRAPADPEPWEGVRVCDTFGDAPVQIFDKTRYYYEYYEHVGHPHMSEDCLYLNICTPAQSSEERHPVFMWFHGGGFTDCYAHEPHFDPKVLASKGVVVVQVGIRLGVFGYLSLPQLSAEQGGHSGNYSVMDQIKALDWVYDNIAAFGGDPETITAGGQSGGATKAEMLATIPAARGRIKRVISQSGLRWYYKFTPQEKMEQQGIDYLRLAGVDENLSCDELRALDTYEVFNRNVDRFDMPGSIARDEVTVPYDSMRDAFAANAAGIDFMNGCNLGEPNFFAASFAGFNARPVREVTPGESISTAAEFYAHFKNLLGPLYDKYDFEKLCPVTDETAWDTLRRLATLGLCGRGGPNIARNLMLARLFGKYTRTLGKESRVYAYLWSQLLPLDPARRGEEIDTDKWLAWHTSEFWFTFGSLGKNVPPHRPWRECDYALADMTTSYWANFILTGDPNGPNDEGKLPCWPEAGETCGYIELKSAPETHNGIEGRLDELIREFTVAEYALDFMG